MKQSNDELEEDAYFSKEEPGKPQSSEAGKDPFEDYMRELDMAVAAEEARQKEKVTSQCENRKQVKSWEKTRWTVISKS